MKRISLTKIESESSNTTKRLPHTVIIDGMVVTFTHKVGNISKAVLPDNTTLIDTYSNGTNSVGRLTKVANGTSSNSYYYDARGNTTSEVQRIDGNDYSLMYAHDKADHITNIVYPSQNQVAYGNGLTEDIDYTTDYKIQSIKLSNGSLDRTHTYNEPKYYPQGFIDSISGVGKYTYGSSTSYRALTSFESETFAYDTLFNMTSGNGKTYTIASTSNRLTSSKQGTDETKYEYDSAGNIIKVSPPEVGATNYVYDNLNRLAKVEVDGLQNGKTLASYQYNAFSQRIQKDVNGAKTIFIYNSAGQLLEEQNKQQNTIRDYIYVDGQLIAAIENGIISYITTDHLNAPQIITSQTGQTIWSAKYDPFGKATVTGNIKYNLRADGQYQDDETGLYYNWYRYYNPELGRYITSDPLGLQAGANTYVYVNGNPVNYTDPMGLETWQCTQPLHALGNNNWNFYVFYHIPYLHHQYSCIVRDGKFECGGQDVVGNPFGGAGKPSDDVFPSQNGNCVKIVEDNKDFENCLREEWSKNRPNYNVLPRKFALRGLFSSSYNCQDYDDAVNNSCVNKSNARTIQYQQGIDLYNKFSKSTLK